jgi:hypothetical protein
MPDVITLEIEGTGDSGVDPEDSEDNDNDAALLLSVRQSVRQIVDHSDSRRETEGVDHQGLNRTALQTEEDLEADEVCRRYCPGCRRGFG